MNVNCMRGLQDGNVITAGGVSCGMDMALHFVSVVLGKAAATEAATFAEYLGHWQDPSCDVKD